MDAFRKNNSRWNVFWNGDDPLITTNVENLHRVISEGGEKYYQVIPKHGDQGIKEGNNFDIYEQVFPEKINFIRRLVFLVFGNDFPRTLITHPRQQTKVTDFLVSGEWTRNSFLNAMHLIGVFPDKFFSPPDVMKKLCEDFRNKYFYQLAEMKESIDSSKEHSQQEANILKSLRRFLSVQELSDLHIVLLPNESGKIIRKNSAEQTLIFLKLQRERDFCKGKATILAVNFDRNTIHKVGENDEILEVIQRESICRMM